HVGGNQQVGGYLLLSVKQDQSVLIRILKMMIIRIIRYPLLVSAKRNFSDVIQGDEPVVSYIHFVVSPGQCDMLIGGGTLATDKVAFQTARLTVINRYPGKGLVGI